MVNAVVLLNIENAKSRLSPFFDLDQRRNMVLIMFSRVLNALEDFPVTVLTRTHKAAIDGVRDSDDINNGIMDIRRKLNDDLLVLPCDLPLLTTSDVLKLMGNSMTLSTAPSQDGGTSGLFIPREVEFTPRFGKNSFALHTGEAEEMGIPLRVYRSDSFRDLDTMEDLRWLLKTIGRNELADYIRSLDLELPLD